mgnify:CR=1 FL=1
MSSPIGHVYLVDDNQDMLYYLSDMLRLNGYTVDTYSSPEFFLRESLDVSPAVLVLDMRMPGFGGLELQQRLDSLGRNTPIIFISGESDKDEIISAFTSGAIAFLWKPFAREKLLEAINKGLELDKQRASKRVSFARLQRNFNTLSAREQELLFLIIDGHTNKAIADRKNIQAATVKKHRAAIFEKFQIANSAELIRMCKGLDLSFLRSEKTS